MATLLALDFDCTLASREINFDADLWASMLESGFGGADRVQALDALFSEFLLPSVSRPWRLLVLGTCLGIFSAVYTTVGGMAAVVRTDIVQCGLMLIGGAVLTWAAISRAGGWGEVTAAAEPVGLLSVHLPADHPVLPWTGTTALYLIGLNYWGSNQVILQRALAARSLWDAQLGLLVGGCLKFVTG